MYVAQTASPLLKQPLCMGKTWFITSAVILLQVEAQVGGDKSGELKDYNVRAQVRSRPLYRSSSDALSEPFACLAGCAAHSTSASTRSR